METSIYTNCPNCQAPIKSGMFGSTEIVEQVRTNFVNLFLEKSAEAYCSKCIPELWSQAANRFRSQSSALQVAYSELLPYVPVVTIQSPLDWKYKVIQMVTAQSVTGTGVLTEFASTFTDLLGMQSGRFNSKIKSGEDICRAQIKMQCIEVGGNAVIATDIDYAEVGGDKGMLMVCMSGTAVRLENPDVLGEGRLEKFRELSYTFNKIKDLSQYAELGSTY
jgi:uncharacterized protein YbjQ (UPF0145 family)